MSAGTGLYHSEYNHSRTEELNFLQIWIIPKKRNIDPRYGQKAFPLESRKNSLKPVISPDLEDTLWINQDAYFMLGHSDHRQIFNYPVRKNGNGLYLFVIEGRITLENGILESRDGMGLTDIDAIDITAEPDSRFLVIEVPLG